MVTEKDIERRIIKYCSQIGSTVFKNEVGLAWTKNGYPIRFGLCVGSSDLIGITPVVITEDMVGKKIGVFTALEIKKNKKGSYKATDQQKAFINFINNNGGKAGVIDSENDVLEVLQCGKK